MTLNDIYEKYLSDSSFKEEVHELLVNNDFDTAIRKYDLSCTKDDLAEFVSDKTETSNCGEDEKKAKIERLERKIEELKELGNALRKALTIACKNEDYDEIKRLTQEIHNNSDRIGELQKQIEELKK